MLSVEPSVIDVSVLFVTPFNNKVTLKTGKYNWSIRSTDKLNQQNTSGKREILVDIDSPNVTLVKPVNAYNQSTNSTVLFNCSAVDNLKLVNITLFLNTSSSWKAN